MKNFKCTAYLFPILLAALLSGCNTKNRPGKEDPGNLIAAKGMPLDVQDQTNIKRVGMVIKIKPERLQDYLRVHSDTNPGVRDLLTKYNMRNFSIFMTRLEDGNYYEFGYYEYRGKDYEADMAALAREPGNIEWLKQTDQMQIPLEGETSWKMMERIFFNY
jgi:L-rhamnose mutarotase